MRFTAFGKKFRTASTAAYITCQQCGGTGMVAATDGLSLETYRGRYGLSLEKYISFEPESPKPK